MCELSLISYGAICAGSGLKQHLIFKADVRRDIEPGCVGEKVGDLVLVGWLYGKGEAKRGCRKSQHDH